MSHTTFLHACLRVWMTLGNNMSPVFSNETILKKKKQKTIVTIIPYSSLNWWGLTSPLKYHNITPPHTDTQDLGGPMPPCPVVVPTTKETKENPTHHMCTITASIKPSGLKLTQNWSQNTLHSYLSPHSFSTRFLFHSYVLGHFLCHRPP